MRFLKTSFLAMVLVLFGAVSASAFELFISRGDSNGAVTSGDTVFVDVNLDAESGLAVLSFGVLYDPTELIYNGAASQALPPNVGNITGNVDGSQPSYILYAPAAGAMAANLLYARQTPFQTWPAPPMDMNQVNVNYASDTLSPTSASGTNLYLATLLFDVVGSGGPRTTDISLCNTCGGNVISANGSTLDPASVPLGGPVVIDLPEPALAGLAIAGLATVAWLRVRRRRQN